MNMKNDITLKELTALVRAAHKQCKGADCHECKVYGNGSDCVYMLIADYLMEHNVSIIRNTTDYIRLPRYGSKIDVKFDSNAIMGTVTLGEESIPVYLTLMSAQQIPNIRGSYAKELEPPVESVKRTFTFAEI